ncbi:uncharacterized protein LOC111692874, partial [Anoplophora glabripennis]|uniref:uncharacterized protein LOC111692874 n=1 Tax=Anoplophora glabripennis TaxID=217634 RepID=UPI000C776267
MTRHPHILQVQVLQQNIRRMTNQTAGWGHLKCIVYEIHVNTIKELTDRSEAAAAERNMIGRFNACIGVRERTIALSNVVDETERLLQKSPVRNIMTTNSWTMYLVSFNESAFIIQKDNQTVLEYKSQKPLVIYWFTVAAESGWVTWSANCEPLDLDGSPRDGGWSAWSPWTCTVTCGGGEGYRTRKCSNPHPNIFGKLCQGSPTSTGKCNDFPCGDLSPQTLEKIQDYLQKDNYSYVIDEGSSLLLKNNRQLLKIVSKESPNAYYEWTLNGIFIKQDPNHVIFKGDNILIENANIKDAGIYVCMLFRINKKRVVLHVISVAVISKNYDYDTRATRSLILNCNSVILGYIYTDLSLKLFLNNEVYIDHGTTTLAAVNIHQFDSLNMSHTGHWRCVVEQKDLKLSWVTNYLKVNVKKAPNVYTNLMEDKLTAPLFGWLKTDRNVLVALIFIVVSVVLLVISFLVIYFKFWQRKEGFGGKTVVFRSMWKVTKGKKIEVAMKMLKQENPDNYLKEFLTLAGQWAFLQSSAIVRLYGIAFTSSISMVLEYFRLGPLDQYLQANRGIMKTVDLIEAASNLAAALWHLRKEGFGGKTVVFRSMWKVTKGKKIEVAMKMLKQENPDNYLKEFLTLAGQWAFLQSSAIVRLYGIAFTSSISMVLEYFRLGPLDQYLQANRGIMKTVDLIEAASNLAAALWHL